MAKPTYSLADLRRDIVTVKYEAADTATPARHNLGRKPVGFVKVNQSAVMGVYQTPDDASRSTDEVIYTRSDATGTTKLEVL